MYVACRVYATSITSVRLSVPLSVTLADCDIIEQQKLEISTGQDSSVNWLSVCDKGMKNVEFCTLAACNGSHVALSQHLL